MIVLHAGFCGNALLVWAEPEAGRKPLLAALAQLGPRFRYSLRSTGTAAAWLPSRHGRPFASSALAGEAPAPGGDCRIAAAAVTVLPLDAAQAIDLLAECAGKRLLAPGLLAGGDLAYWTSALRFAAGLVMRGRFLPGFEPHSGGYAARWMPVIAGEELARAAALARAMPPAARALTLEAAGEPPDTAAGTVLAEFTAFAADGLVRASGAAAPHTVDSVHDRWLRALVSPDAAVSGSPAELALLAGQAAEWRRPVEISARAPVRLPAPGHPGSQPVDRRRRGVEPRAVCSLRSRPGCRGGAGAPVGFARPGGRRLPARRAEPQTEGAGGL